ncbi:hypothetical protein NKI74_31220, partial [Mesorhizobium sp. M0494]|uniref:hypothetical protein n=1 Tax=Mesorhizobium sp. M0494 TaxID=2956951 RepID=UPI003335E93D
HQKLDAGTAVLRSSWPPDTRLRSSPDGYVGADGKLLLVISGAGPGQSERVVELEQHGAQTLQEALAGRGWADAAGMAAKSSYPPRIPDRVCAG